MSGTLRAVLIALVLFTACDDRDDPAPSGDAVATTSTTTPTASGPVRVPDLTGLPGKAAARELRAIGLRPVVHAVAGSACVPPGVLRQRPVGGSVVDAGERVRVEVNSAVGECGPELPPAAEELIGIARAFIRFADGGKVPRFTSEVGLHLGNRLIETVPAASLAHAKVWRICPPEGGYAAASCPLSARDHVTRWPGRLATTHLAASHPCAHSAEPPPTWAGLRRVTITPDESLACPSYWAVELYVDDRGRISAVNLVRSEP